MRKPPEPPVKLFNICIYRMHILKQSNAIKTISGCKCRVLKSNHACGFVDLQNCRKMLRFDTLLSSTVPLKIRLKITRSSTYFSPIISKTNVLICIITIIEAHLFFSFIKFIGLFSFHTLM